MLPLGSNKVPGQIKQGGGLDSAHGPCVCHLVLWHTLGQREVHGSLLCWGRAFWKRLSLHGRKVAIGAAAHLCSSSSGTPGATIICNHEAIDTNRESTH